jgi:hypothetical protein
VVAPQPASLLTRCVRPIGCTSSTRPSDRDIWKSSATRDLTIPGRNSGERFDGRTRSEEAAKIAPGEGVSAAVSAQVRPRQVSRLLLLSSRRGREMHGDWMRVVEPPYGDKSTLRSKG